MSARDELADVFTGHTVGFGGFPKKLMRGHAQEIAERILAAGYRKVEPGWAETLTNDGTYEYTVSSDCDGSNVKRWRRKPGHVYEEPAAPWRVYEP